YGNAWPIPVIGNYAIARHDEVELVRLLKKGTACARNTGRTMAEVFPSTTEAALENQKIGALQLRVALFCTLIQICHGYDINSIGWAVPSLKDIWHLPPPAFTTAFLWSSIGILVGALSAGPIGDRVGRKPLLLASLAIFGLASLASAAAG